MAESNFHGADTKQKNADIERQRKDEKRRELRDLRRLLRNPEFRRFYWRKLSECGVFNSSFNVNTKLADFREGQRDIGITLLQELNKADGNAFAAMQREAVSEALSKQTEEDSSDGE